MKTQYIKDVTADNPKKIESLPCWISNKRILKDIIFIEIADSTGSLSVIAKKEFMADKSFLLLKSTPTESCVELVLERTIDPIKKVESLFIRDFKIVGEWKLNLQPSPRKNFDVFSAKQSDFLLKNRHLYIRNPKVMAMLKFRHQMMGAVHRWYREQGFIEITAPVLTQLPLYDDGSALSLKINGDTTYLTQCVGFYLESAVAAFEKVYNIGPSFRGEESRSKRHLMEYWHIKAEVAFANLEEGQKMIEDLVSYLVQDLIENGQDVLKILDAKPAKEVLSAPYPKISYREAVKLLNQSNHKFEFGKSLSSIEEGVLAEKFTTPFWIVGIPKSLEPFPYVVDPQDDEVTRVSDLISNRGYGELLGVAEKIYNYEELQQRMGDKGKLENPNYKWVQELRQSGFFPHVGFGMGVERFIRYVLGQEHVRDAIPFPRVFRRQIYP